MNRTLVYLLVFHFNQSWLETGFTRDGGNRRRSSRIITATARVDYQNRIIDWGVNEDSWAAAENWNIVGLVFLTNNEQRHLAFDFSFEVFGS